MKLYVAKHKDGQYWMGGYRAHLCPGTSPLVLVTPSRARMESEFDIAKSAANTFGGGFEFPVADFKIVRWSGPRVEKYLMRRFAYKEFGYLL